MLGTLFIAAMLQSTAVADMADYSVLGTARLECGRTPDAIGCRGRENARYRIDSELVAEPTPHVRALDESWRRCGLLGMPVCPAKGTTLIQSTDEPTEEGPAE